MKLLTNLLIFSNAHALFRSNINLPQFSLLPKSLKKEPVENIFFYGGGAKGAGYPAVLAALYDAGIWSDINRISAVSAGCLPAIAMSVGMKPDQLITKMLALDLKNVLNKFEFYGPNIIPGVTLSLDPLRQLLNGFLVETTLDFLNQQTFLPPSVLRIYNLLNQGNQELNFYQHHELVNNYPNQFKEISIAAVDYLSGKLVEFNVNTSPNVSIAHSCTASSSLPGTFNPQQINGRYIQDGVLQNPLPTECSLPVNSSKNTLIFMFNNSVWHELITSGTQNNWLNYQKQIRDVDRLYLPIINGIFFFINFSVFSAKVLIYPLAIIYLLLSKNTNRATNLVIELDDILKHLLIKPVGFSQEEVSVKIRDMVKNEYVNRTILLDSGELGTTSFKEAQLSAKTLNCLYYLDTMEFLLKANLYQGSLLSSQHQLFRYIVTNYQNILKIESLSSSNLLSAEFAYREIRQLIKLNLSSPEAKALEQVTFDLMREHQLRRDIKENNLLKKTGSFFNKLIVSIQPRYINSSHTIQKRPTLEKSSRSLFTFFQHMNQTQGTQSQGFLNDTNQTSIGFKK